jgi:hypothetical protein
LGPTDLLSAYALPNGGAGRTVAVFGGNNDVPAAESNLATYRAQYGLPECSTANGCFLKIASDGSTNYPPASTYELETDLDLDMVSAGCPACKIVLIEGDIGAALATVKAMGVSAFSTSWLYSGTSLCDSSGFGDTSSGLLVTAAAGDGGYPSNAQPTVCRGVVAVGGTTLVQDSSSRGWSESAWSHGGSGCSDVAKPSWQTDSGCAMRTIADVSAVADIDNSPVAVYGVYNGSAGWLLVGGTSAAAPLVAAALTNTGVANGHFSPAWIWQHSGAFNDVTAGSNGTCTGQAPYVCNTGPGYDGPTGWGTPNGSLLLAALIPPYAAQIVSQSFPLGATITMVEGQVIPSYIELKNIGSQSWGSNTYVGTTEPRDRNSAFADGTWVNPNRVSGVQGTVNPGGTYTFMFDLAAPSPGSYDELFGVVEQGVAWFSDPGQGGPADNVLEVKINVIAAADLGGAGRDGSSDGGDGGALGDGGASAPGDGGSSAPGDDAGDAGDVHGKPPSHGCGCSVGAAASDTDGSGLAVVLLIVAVAARRTSKWLAASLTMAMLVGCAPAPKLIIGSTVALYSPEHKRFVRLNSNGFVDAADPVPGPEALPASWLWERFLIVDGGGGTVALYNERNRRFIRINTLGDADSAFPVDRLPASWTRERFTPVDAGWGTIAFYNRASHRFLRMKPDGICDSAHPVSGPESLPYDWTWERFRIIQVARIASPAPP